MDTLTMTRLIVLTGAPAPSALDWDEDTLSHRLQVPRDWSRAIDRWRSPGSTEPYSAQWRRVPTRDTHPDLGQQHTDQEPSCYAAAAIFLNTAELLRGFDSQRESTSTSTPTNAISSIRSISTAAVDLDDFYDQSFALHDDQTTSQLSEFESQTTTAEDGSWSGVNTPVQPSKPIENIPTAVSFQIWAQHVTDVKDIPSAPYIRRIEPQTMTVNLIVGIMALQAPRMVTVGRRDGRERQMRLVEMLVGDDTRAGFEVTMWLDESAHQSLFSQRLQSLRRRDIVLLRNVALAAFQGRVHGQSLRRDVTKVDLLHRRQVNDSDIGGFYPSPLLLGPAENDPVLKKMKRVNQWLVEFVGYQIAGPHQEGSRGRRPLLPPDTP